MGARVSWRRLSRIVPLIVVGALLATAAGLGAGALVHPGDLAGSAWYSFLAGFLLAIGLYGSTHEIDLGALRRDARGVLVAVTLGVVIKAVLIAGVMLLVFHDARYLVLGIAVAQIDPLSVAAMRANSRMSARAKALLFAWASFDDPVTVLLSLYFSILAFRLSGRDGSPKAGPSEDGLGAYLTDLGLNLALAAAAFGVFVALRGLRKPVAPAPGPAVARPSARRGAEAGGRFADLLSLAVLPVVFLVAAQWMLMLAVAVIGLFLRVGAYAKVVDRAVATAFLVASFALGLLLVDGVDLLPAVVLGVAAFGAQALISLLVVPVLEHGLSGRDRVHLALGQQNGITAIILALALEPDFRGTVGIVAPAILVVNVLHYASNGVLNRYAGDPPHPPADEPGPPGTGAFRPGALSGAAPASGPPDPRPSPETDACASAPGADPET
ncbi:hypothetical protein BKA00_003830 [Actinomadura coerulea]|uniref:Cation/H+ exchanger domain-containing protein n=1 Tax=Actinomadura coerulea TaxID=46159 RepID=A0A7X0KZW1_9ACTN|nr:hypothetical protein [Actinomadura coerulea]MBB6396916.1 hypothetical protein [Actinomadura coerulea]GGP95314.1 hypothetical protein GCM10010187_08580 [Actinomadura coerulea]